VSPLNFDDLPSWAQALVTVSIVIAFLLGLLRAVRPWWKFVTRFVRMVNSSMELPEFIERTDQTLKDQNATLAAQKEILDDHTAKIEEIHHEVHFNNGSSVKDAVTRVEKRQLASNRTQRRIEKGVAGLYDRVDAADAAAAEIRKDFDDTHPKEKP
jgi:hypothetical protein